MLVLTAIDSPEGLNIARKLKRLGQRLSACPKAPRHRCVVRRGALQTLDEGEDLDVRLSEVVPGRDMPASLSERRLAGSKGSKACFKLA